MTAELAVWLPAALIGLANHSERFRVALIVAVLLAPGVAYAGSPHWVRIHVWGGLFGVHYGRHVAPKTATRKPAALSSPTPEEAPA